MNIKIRHRVSHVGRYPALMRLFFSLYAFAAASHKITEYVKMGENATKAEISENGRFFINFVFDPAEFDFAFGSSAKNPPISAVFTFCV